MLDSDSFAIVGMAGSLRSGSFNRALLLAMAELAPDGISIDTFDLSPVPLYNADLDESLDGGPYPDAVRDLRAAVEQADAVLLTTPEYNWGSSGVLKNAIDWLSRPAGASPLNQKPIALAGASKGMSGTGRGQLQLRQNLLATNSYVLQRPSIQVGNAKDHFDEHLRLIDEELRTKICDQLIALREWSRRHQPMSAPLP